MEDILELHGGKAKIQPLNYDALAMLRNPLYVKFAQELKDRSSEMNKGILAKQTEDAAVRQMASDNNWPQDHVREVVQRAPVEDASTQTAGQLRLVIGKKRDTGNKDKDRRDKDNNDYGGDGGDGPAEGWGGGMQQLNKGTPPC